MKKNLGTCDRTGRVVLAIALAFVAFTASGWTATLLYLLALAMLVTAALGYCHLYTLLGVNTNGPVCQCKKESDACCKKETK